MEGCLHAFLPDLDSVAELMGNYFINDVADLVLLNNLSSVFFSYLLFYYAATFWKVENWNFT